MFLDFLFVVVSTLQNFVRMFHRAHDENCKQLELEKKKAEKEAENEKAKMVAQVKGSENQVHQSSRRSWHREMSNLHAVQSEGH